MPDSKKKVSYWKAIGRITYEDIGTATVLSGMGGAVLASLFAPRLGYAKPEDVTAMVFLAVCGAAVAFLLEMLVRLLVVSPRKLFNDLNKQSASQEVEICQLKDRLDSHLDVKPIPCEVTEQPRACGIFVENNGGRTAENVQIELTELIGWPTEFRWNLPMILPPLSREGHTIHPGKKIALRIFDLSTNADLEKRENQFVYFVNWMQFLPGSDPAKILAEKEKVLSSPFFPNKDYRIRLKITARDLFPKTHELVLNLSDKTRTGELRPIESP